MTNGGTYVRDIPNRTSVGKNIDKILHGKKM
jgi:hypothetical protein